MKLTDFLKADQVILNLEATTKNEVLREVSRKAFELNLVPDEEALYQGLLAREGLISTGIGGGIAIPHTRYQGPQQISIIIAKSLKGVDFDSLDNEPVNLFVVIFGPESADKDQLKVLSRTARLLKKEEFRARLAESQSQEEIVSLVEEEDRI